MSLEQTPGQEQSMTLQRVEESVRNEYKIAQSAKEYSAYTYNGQPGGEQLIEEKVAEGQKAWELWSQTINPDNTVNWGAVRPIYEARLHAREAEQKGHLAIIDQQEEDRQFQTLQPMVTHAERRSRELHAQFVSGIVSPETHIEQQIFAFAAKELKDRLHQTPTMTAIRENSRLLKQISHYKQVLSVIPKPPLTPVQ